MADTVTLGKRPDCDLCGDPAYYDAKTKSGPWGYLCEEDYEEVKAHGSLGTGKGQRISGRE